MPIRIAMATTGVPCTHLNLKRLHSVCFKYMAFGEKQNYGNGGRDISDSQGIVNRDIVKKQAIVLVILFDAVPKCPTEK